MARRLIDRAIWRFSGKNTHFLPFKLATHQTLMKLNYTYVGSADPKLSL